MKGQNVKGRNKNKKQKRKKEVEKKFGLKIQKKVRADF